MNTNFSSLNASLAHLQKYGRSCDVVFIAKEIQSKMPAIESEHAALSGQRNLLRKAPVAKAWLELLSSN